MLNLKVKYEALKDFMKRKTIVFLLSLFFVTSVVAISTVNNGEQVTLIGDYEQVELNETEESTNSNVVATETSEDSNYVAESEVLLVETKEDKQRLKVQEKQIKRGKQKQLTADLNKQTKQALERQIAEKGKPFTAANNQDVVIINAANKGLSLQPSKTTQLASLTTEQQLAKKRKTLSLGPPIPPGTFGGGNGNGGPGAGVSSQTASGN